MLQGWGPDAGEIDPSTVDWTAVTGRNLPCHFRREPGPGNALGRVKFMFPNSYNLYLHDTPSRELFARDRRASARGAFGSRRPWISPSSFGGDVVREPLGCAAFKNRIALKIDGFALSPWDPLSSPVPIPILSPR